MLKTVSWSEREKTKLLTAEIDEYSWQVGYNDGRDFTLDHLLEWLVKERNTQGGHLFTKDDKQEV